MKTVICRVELFELHQYIHVADGNNVSTVAISHVDNLGSDIAMVCDKYHVDNVHLYGSEDYLKTAIEDLKQSNITKYGNRPLNIEVN